MNIFTVREYLLSYPYKSLTRTGIDKIPDRGISIGQFRLLAHSEINYLRKSTADKTPG
jgi:hypothetical protein